MIRRLWPTIALVALPAMAMAQQGHDMAGHHMGAPLDGPTEAGQAAFAAIAEIVGILQADPATDWSRVDIDALRQHLVDMDNVTLHANVASRDIDGGADFAVTAESADVATSIRAMVPAHAAMMTGAQGLMMATEPLPDGVRLTVTGPAPEMIRGLGFFGIMALGGHHQPHHLAIARGQAPHGGH
ncbi:hypothetical protein [Rhodovulum sp. P5]|uniref:hypothetical protein n=1 Tax=Rhodovulum sp. P5 TaxID=1564506 RepID=UPI0009DA4433|nr:hypothetical protein [Rhodovulum sp. P5]